MTAEVSSPNLSDWSTNLGLIDCAGVFFRRRDISPIPSGLDEPIQSSWECWWKLWTLCSQVDQDQLYVRPNENSTLVLIPGRLAEKMEGDGRDRRYSNSMRGVEQITGKGVTSVPIDPQILLKGELEEPPLPHNYRRPNNHLSLGISLLLI